MKEEELANKFAKSIKLAEELKQQELEQCANQRVIEELEKLDGVDNIRYEIENRIKKLKQKQNLQ